MCIAIVVSQFNQELTEQLLVGAQQRLQELQFPIKKIDIVKVPGAIEIPLAAQLLAVKNRYAAIICLGVVIRGETSHYESVCHQVSYGCQRVALDNKTPVIFGVLTVENELQALDRLGGKHGHKGRDAIDAAMQMIEIVKQTMML